MVTFLPGHGVAAVFQIHLDAFVVFEREQPPLDPDIHIAVAQLILGRGIFGLEVEAGQHHHPCDVSLGVPLRALLDIELRNVHVFEIIEEVLLRDRHFHAGDGLGLGHHFFDQGLRPVEIVVDKSFQNIPERLIRRRQAFNGLPGRVVFSVIRRENGQIQRALGGEQLKALRIVDRGKLRFPVAQNGSARKRKAVHRGLVLRIVKIASRQHILFQRILPGPFGDGVAAVFKIHVDALVAYEIQAVILELDPYMAVVQPLFGHGISGLEVEAGEHKDHRDLSRRVPVRAAQIDIRNVDILEIIEEILLCDRHFLNGQRLGLGPHVLDQRQSSLVVLPGKSVQRSPERLIFRGKDLRGRFSLLHRFRLNCGGRFGRCGGGRAAAAGPQGEAQGQRKDENDDLFHDRLLKSVDEKSIASGAGIGNRGERRDPFAGTELTGPVQ